ncbi:MAG: response regulator [Syntrophales bacterium]
MSRKRILIVDDDALILQGLAKVIKKDATEAGAEVATAETGEAALAEINSSPCHLCFLDIFLPDTDGTEVLKKIRAVSPATKVVMMSAGIISDDMRENIEKNAYMFVPKPFDLMQIRMLVKIIIEEQ